MAILKRFDLTIYDEDDGYDPYLLDEENPNGSYCYANEAAAIIEPLESDRVSISKILDRVGIEHSGHVAQAARVQMLAERDARHVNMIKERQLKIKELEAKIAELTK